MQHKFSADLVFSFSFSLLQRKNVKHTVGACPENVLHRSLFFWFWFQKFCLSLVKIKGATLSPFPFSVLRALQEENADLHQNLLQTVVCIESLEAELQRTRDELSHVKEKYKR